MTNEFAKNANKPRRNNSGKKSTPVGQSRRAGKSGVAESKNRRGGSARQGSNLPQKNARNFDTHASRARVLALDALTQVRTRDAFAHDVIESVVEGAGLSAADKAFATLLVVGSVQMQGSLDAVINRVLDRPGDLSPALRDALRLSSYEILFLDKDTYAAVDQGVELAKVIAPKAAGLANAVLRKIARMKESFPFGDVTQSTAAFALAYGLPKWLVEHLAGGMDFAALQNFAEASMQPAPIYIAVNELADASGDVLKVLEAAEADVRPVQVDGVQVERCFELGNRRALADRHVARLLEEGKIFVTDASAQFIAQTCIEALLDACSGSAIDGLSFLELCAGRGTKTLLLQNAFQAKAGAQLKDYTALDNLDYKIGILQKRVRACDVHVQQAVVGDAANLAVTFPNKKFDCVFLDAPCTGLGTLRRHPEIRNRLTPQKIADAAALDAKLLASTAKVVALGGLIVYSTCTVTREECEAAVAGFLKSPQGAAFKLVQINGKPAYKPALTPGAPDAHFAAILKRTEE
jgi:16S rRNA (cytosine967-C5)-methyltransferase